MMQAPNIELMLDSLYKMHTLVQESWSKLHEDVSARYKAKTNVLACSSSIWDYVLVSHQRGPSTKVSANWVGSRGTVQELSDIAFGMEHLLAGKTGNVHFTRIKFNDDSQVGWLIPVRDPTDFQTGFGLHNP